MLIPRLLAVLLLLPVFAHADQLVTNGGFETGGFTGWTVTKAPSGSDIFVGPSYENTAQDKYAAHFDGLTYRSYDTIQQQLSTVAGGTYGISFDLSEQGCDVTSCDFQAFWNGTLFYDSFGAQGGSNESFDYTLSGQGSDVLTFRGYNQPSRSLLDNVSVTTLAPPPNVVTPEPCSLMLLATGLACSGLRLRWRKQ